MGGKYHWEVVIEDELPEIPKDLLSLIKDIRNNHGVTPVTERDKKTGVTLSDGPAEGRRDDALFHTALTMARGGASFEEVAESVLAMAAPAILRFLGTRP